MDAVRTDEPARGVYIRLAQPRQVNLISRQVPKGEFSLWLANAFQGIEGVLSRRHAYMKRGSTAPHVEYTLQVHQVRLLYLFARVHLR